MFNFTIGIIVGAFVMFVICLIYANNDKKYRLYGRHCLNCRYAEPMKATNDTIHTYCTRLNGTQYPVNISDYCGHFDFTEELKAEQVKQQAERMVK